MRTGAPPSPITDPRRFTPEAIVGGRLPHAWLDDGRSTLDLVDSTGFTLLSFDEHDTWAAAVSDVEAPIRQVRFGVDATVCDGSSSWVPDGGSLLVRPDQHITWRGDSADDASSLRSVVPTVLGR